MNKLLLFLCMLITAFAPLQSQVYSSRLSTQNSTIDTTRLNELQAQIDILIAANNTLLASFNREDEILGFASGSVNNTGVIQDRECTITKLATGQYQVVFDRKHPDGDKYGVLFGVREDANRDVPKAWVEDGTQTEDGLVIGVTVDDNGSSGDIRRDDIFSFSIDYVKKILTDATN